MPTSAPFSDVASSEVAWHALPPDEVARRLDVDPAQGLTSGEAARRLEEVGANQLPEAPGTPALIRFLRHFHNVLIYILLVAAAFTGLLGEWIDTGVILLVVVVNAVVGFIQEGKAEEALEGIRGLLSPTARVRRGGKSLQLDAADLVPGDVVRLEGGDRVPADLRIISALNARAEEALLTGESEPVEKTPNPVDAAALPADQRGMVFSGTLVTTGRLVGIVTATGTRTEIGKIGQMVAGVEGVTTPLLRQIDRFGTQLSLFIVGASVAVFLAGWQLRGLEVTAAFLAVVALAVAAIPEGLPAILTITLALGVQRMARQNAIIRKLPAVETLGSVSVICTDKTGTLTRNEMSAERLLLADETLGIEGTGYEPTGRILRLSEDAEAPDRGGDAGDSGDTPGGREASEALEAPGAPDAPGPGPSIAEHPLLARAARIALLCNEANFADAEDAEPADAGHGTPPRVLQGDPTEGALLVLAERAGLGPDASREFEERGIVPFESARAWMAVVHDGPDGERVARVKGAPEKVMAQCARVAGPEGDVPLDEGTRARWERRMEALAGKGYRLLALADAPWGGATGREAAKGGGTNQITRNGSAATTDTADEGGPRLRGDTEDSGEALAARIEALGSGDGLTLVGVAALMDPPRPEAAKAVTECQAAGIRVLMITGDHALTARSIGARLGIGDGSGALTGAMVAEASDEALDEALALHDVVARAGPEHKLRIVKRLQAGGRVCAMTGDGVNDAPALKQADIGVAMGIKGTEAARSASEMVLADDNFASIRTAVEEGRTVYDNLTKTILFILPTNGAEALVVLAGVALALGDFPITPVQILWVNMITAVTLALALAFEPAEPGIMKRPPREPDEPLLNRYLLRRVAYVSVLVALGCILLFKTALRQGAEPELARTLVVNALVAAQLLYLFNCRFRWKASMGWQALVGNRAVLVASGLLVLFQLGFTYLPIFHLLFGTAPLPAVAWLPVLSVGLVLFGVVELEKAWGRRRGHEAATTRPLPDEHP